MATVTPISYHQPDQLAAIEIKARPSTGTKIPTCWSSNDGLAFFSNKVFIKLRYVHFLDNASILNILQYSINITLTCTEKPKKIVWLTLWWYLLYCGRLEPNAQYLKGIPEFLYGVSSTYKYSCVFVFY